MAAQLNAQEVAALQAELQQYRDRAARHPSIALPSRFAGDPTHVQNFVGQCEMYLELRQHEFATDRARVGFIYNLTDGPAASWISSLLTARAPAVATPAALLAAIRQTWAAPVNARLAARKIARLSTKDMSLAQYISMFRVLAAQLDWNDSALQYHFMTGLSAELQQEMLRSAIPPANLEAMITQSLDVEAGMQARRQWDRPTTERPPAARGPPPPRTLPRSYAPLPAPTDEPEPMQLGTVRPKVDAAEKARRQRLNLCWYCGGAGHFARECPQKTRTQGPRINAAIEAAPSDPAPATAVYHPPAGEDNDRV